MSTDTSMTIRIDSKLKKEADDPFYSEENIKKLEAAARRMDEGRYVEHEATGEFDEYILSDLVKEGYLGEDLVKEFKVRRKKIRPAVEKIIEEADEAAQGRGKAYTL